jgi:Na+/H+ antiporter NhaD/arsenite permease-like protein
LVCRGNTTLYRFLLLLILTLSQPLALYNLVMIDNGFAGDDVYEWMMLAAASTIAGNLTILGAASNIIIIGAAESRGFKSFGYVEFLKIGSIVTLVTVIIYHLFILFVSYI